MALEMAGNKQNMAPMWKKLMKNVDVLGTPIISWPCVLGMHSTWMQTEWSDVDDVPTNTHSCQGDSQLYIFEDNEAVIKMIIKGRSPTMRLVVKNPQSCVRLVVRQNQFRTRRSKPNMLTPKTKSRTCWPKEVSQEMSGITFCVCSILWVSRCVLVAILAIFFLTILIRLESKTKCRKEARRRVWNEGSATAKAKPCLVLRDREQRSEEISSLWCHM